MPVTPRGSLDISVAETPSAVSIAAARTAIEEIALSAPKAVATLPLAVTIAPGTDLSLHLEGVSMLRARLREEMITWASPEAIAEGTALIDDDFTLYRFLHAREFNQDNAVSMFRGACAWRAERAVNAIFSELHPAAPTSVRHAASREYFYAGYCGVNKTGGPVVCERLGVVDLRALNQQPEALSLMLDAYCSYLESLFRMVRLASARSGRLVRATIVVDASGVSFSTLRNIGVIKTVASIGPPNYPEVTSRVYIVNAPVLFSAMWNIISPLLPAHTRTKVKIYASDFLPHLLQDVDADQLPDFLGGARQPGDVALIPAAKRLPSTLGRDLAAAAADGG